MRFFTAYLEGVEIITLIGDYLRDIGKTPDLIIGEYMNTIPIQFDIMLPKVSRKYFRFQWDHRGNKLFFNTNNYGKEGDHWIDLMIDVESNDSDKLGQFIHMIFAQHKIKSKLKNLTIYQANDHIWSLNQASKMTLAFSLFYSNCYLITKFEPIRKAQTTNWTPRKPLEKPKHDLTETKTQGTENFAWKVGCDPSLSYN